MDIYKRKKIDNNKLKNKYNRHKREKEKECAPKTPK